MPHYSSTTDGHFDLFYRHGWAYLVVHPPAPGGKPVYQEDIESRMKLLGVPKVESKKIRAIIEEAKGKAEPLVEWPEGSRLASEISVFISEDKMSASVVVKPPKKGAAPPLPEDIEDELRVAGVLYGIDPEKIEKLLARREYDTKVTVAEGSPPVHGSSGEVRYHFNPNRGKPYLEMEFGRINLKELNFIENKKEGDLLAELLPPVQPKDGKTVTGEVLPADTASNVVTLKGGKNTRLSEDRAALYAAEDGNVRLLEPSGTVIIEPVVTVDNVNYETGNIYFDGSVVVNKGIADGFVIEADGDIQVGRGVGKATLKAGGNILLKTGINGNKEGHIECGGNLFAKYVESSTIICKGHLLAEEAIMHSRISVWKHCVLNGRRSEIIAGNLIVGGSLWCKKLGSIYEAPTTVAIGIPPELLTEYRDAKKMVEEKQEQFNNIEEKLEQIERAIADGHKENKLFEARKQLTATAADISGELPALRHRINELRSQLKASRRSIVVVEDTMYKNVTIIFGNMEYRAPDKGVRKTILKAGERDIVESGFNPFEKPALSF
jgi:hypothetical protein